MGWWGPCCSSASYWHASAAAGGTVAVVAVTNTRQRKLVSIQPHMLFCAHSSSQNSHTHTLHTHTHTYTHTHTHTDRYQTMTWPKSAVTVGNNPTYFGTNTLLSSRSGTMSTQNGSLPRNQPQYSPPNVPAANAWEDRSLQNPVYFSQLKDSTDSATSPVPPPTNGPLSADDEHPYDTIPALRGVSPAVPISQGGYGYASLVESPTPGPVKSRQFLGSPKKEISMAASGRYDQLEGQAAENPYVVGPNQPHVVLPSATAQISEPENPKKKKPDGADQNTLNIPIPPSTSRENPYDSLPQSK